MRTDPFETSTRKFTNSSGKYADNCTKKAHHTRWAFKRVYRVKSKTLSELPAAVDQQAGSHTSKEQGGRCRLGNNCQVRDV